MNTNNEDEWVKTSERKPTEFAFPIYTYNRAGGLGWMCSPAAFDRGEITHWRCDTNAPKRPKPEPTQAETDRLDFLRWADAKRITYDVSPTWHAALKHEREAIWAEWQRLNNGGDASEFDVFHSFQHWLRARCGKDAK